MNLNTTDVVLRAVREVYGKRLHSFARQKSGNKYRRGWRIEHKV